MAVSGFCCLPNVVSKVRTLESSRKTVYLTFDDGPNEKYTPRILDILNKHKIKATFFYVGSNMIKYSKTCKKVHEEKHSIHNHSMTHANFSTISPKNAKEELQSARKVIEDVTGIQGYKLFRPPWGLISLKNIYVAKTCNERVMFWSKDGPNLDGKYFPGDIILLHEDDPNVFIDLQNVINTLSKENIIMDSMENSFIK